MTHAWFSTMDKCTISLRLEFSTGLSMQMPNISSCFSLSLYLTAATAWNKAYNITANQRLGTHGATHWLSSCIWFIFPCYVNPYRALPLHLPPGSLLVQLLQGRCRAARKDTFFLFMLFKLKVSPPHHELNRVLRQAPAAASPPSRYWTAPRFENCGTYQSFDYSRSNAFHVNLLQADLISLMALCSTASMDMDSIFPERDKEEDTKGNRKQGQSESCWFSYFLFQSTWFIVYHLWCKKRFKDKEQNSGWFWVFLSE